MTVVAGTATEQLVGAGMTPGGVVVVAAGDGVRNTVTTHYLAPLRMMRENLDWHRDRALAGVKMRMNGEIGLEVVEEEGGRRRILMIVAAVIEREQAPSNCEAAVAYSHRLTVAVA